MYRGQWLAISLTCRGMFSLPECHNVLTPDMCVPARHAGRTRKGAMKSTTSGIEWPTGKGPISSVCSRSPNRVRSEGGGGFLAALDAWLPAA